MKKRLYFTTLLVICLTIPSVVSAETVSIDPPEMTSPEVGQTLTLEVIIEGAKGLFGFEFDLSYNPEFLKFVNATEGDFLQSTGQTFVVAPLVYSEKPKDGGAGTIATGVSLLGGAGVNGDGVLAKVEFEVIKKIDALIFLEFQTFSLFDAQGNKKAPENVVASIITSGQQEFKLELQEGINLISVPLDLSKDENPWRLSELLDFIGSSATMIIRYDKSSKKFVTYMPHFPETSPANAVVQGGEGYVIMMKEPASMTFTGKAWDGMVSLAAGINVISVPLNPGLEWRMSDLISFIGKDATMIIRYDKSSKKFVTYMPHFPETSPANAVVRGGEGYVVMMSKPVTITFTGTAWKNTAAASP